MAGLAAAIPIWNLVWRRHTNLLKFGQLIFRKIIKIVANRCQILWLKCAKIDFAWRYAPDPVKRAYSLSITVLPCRPYSWNKGDLLLREGNWCRTAERSLSVTQTYLRNSLSQGKMNSLHACLPRGSWQLRYERHCERVHPLWWRETSKCIYPSISRPSSWSMIWSIVFFNYVNWHKCTYLLTYAYIFTVAWAVVESALLTLWLPVSVLHLLEYSSNTFLR